MFQNASLALGGAVAPPAAIRPRRSKARTVAMRMRDNAGDGERIASAWSTASMGLVDIGAMRSADATTLTSRVGFVVMAT